MFYVQSFYWLCLRQREAHVNQYNARRQQALNAAAEYYGAGTGTASYYGVPGTNYRFYKKTVLNCRT